MQVSAELRRVNWVSIRCRSTKLRTKPSLPTSCGSKSCKNSLVRRCFPFQQPVAMGTGLASIALGCPLPRYASRISLHLFSQIMSQRLQDHTLVDAFELYRHIARSRSGWLSSRLVCVNEYDMGDFGRSLLVDWESQQLLVSVGSTQLKVRVLESAAVRQCRPPKLGCSV